MRLSSRTAVVLRAPSGIIMAQTGDARRVIRTTTVTHSEMQTTEYLGAEVESATSGSTAYHASRDTWDEGPTIQEIDGAGNAILDMDSSTAASASLKKSTRQRAYAASLVRRPWAQIQH
jgi:hypothetical protein